MKKLRILLLMLVAILCISGCSFAGTSDSASNSVRDISDTRIFVDSETNVMYTWYKSGYGGGMSIMLNADGTPKVYDKTTSKYTDTRDISDTRIFVDSETNVMYTWYKRGYGGGMSVMLNADGSSKLYEQQ